MSLRFPLRGEWTAIRTPAARIPSHGTDFFGQRFACDFVRPTTRAWAPFGPALWAWAYGIVPAHRFAAWDAPVCAAQDGRVLQAADGWPDRIWVNALWEWGRLLAHRARPPRITRTDWRALTGNYVLLEGADGVALYAHLRRGSLAVRAGERVAAGDRLGRVGNSGRSSMPHLHFHLMDRADAFSAVGRPCVFEGYERWDGSAWRAVGQGIPGYRERIRAL